MPRLICNAGKYKRRASDVDSCLTGQSDLKPTTATVGGRYFATLNHKRLEAQVCLAPRAPNPFRNLLFRVWPWHAPLWRRAHIEQRDEGRAGTVGGINFATFEHYVFMKNNKANIKTQSPITPGIKVVDEKLTFNKPPAERKQFCNLQH